MKKETSKTVIVPRLHEQREYFRKKVFVIDRLRKNILIEVLDWCSKTERVDIHHRFRLKSYSWDKEKDKKYDYLTLDLKEIDIEKDKTTKKEIIDKIMTKHFDTLKYSLVTEIIKGIKRHEDDGGLLSLDIIEKKLKEKKDDKNFKFEQQSIL